MKPGKPLRHVGLKKQAAGQRYPELKRKQIRAMSARQKAKEDKWQRLGTYLMAHRARGRCENCGGVVGLQRAHIIPRGRGGAWNAGNMMIACSPGCHNHQKYADGLKCGIGAALAIVERLNKQAGIDPLMEDFNGAFNGGNH